MLQVLIDSGSGYVDYSKYTIDDSISVTQTINQPTTIDLKFCNYDDQFVIPTRSSYIKIYSTDNALTLATGFITQDPEIEFFNQVRAKNLLSYRIVATSDEWILNKKPIPFIPAFVNQTMGSILRTLAETLVPGFFTYQINDGDIVPYFAYDSNKSWTEIAKSFYDSIRYHYYALDKVLYFKPLGDLNLGLKYDDSLTRTKTGKTSLFDPVALKTQLQPITVVNDAIVIGDVEPRNYVEENFIGDGFTSDFGLKTKVFRGASSLLLQEDWTGTAFNKNLWTTLDTTGKFTLAGTLNLLAGSGASTLGTAYIVGHNGLELGGHLNIQAGQVEFNSTASRGILGGVYSSSTLTLANCSVGFMVSGGNIRPIVNGVPQDPLATIVASTIALSKQYVLQTIISSNQWSRYNRVFSTLAGVPYGGTQVSAAADITFIIQDVSLPTPTLLVPAPRATTQTNRIVVKGVTLPAFGVFAPVNSVDLQATVASTLISQPPQAKLSVRSLYGASGTNLPVTPSGLSIEQNYMIGFGMAGQVATIQSTSDIQLLSFYDDTIPSAGARIKLRYWEAGAAMGRVRNQALITAERKIPGDDGVRTAIVSDLNPLPRTSVECELAGAAYIADRTQTQFNGSYEVQNNYWFLNAAGVTGNTDYPRPGRFFNINSPMRNITNRDFLVQSVKMTVDLQKIEQFMLSISFGPDLYINKLLPSFVKNIGNSVLTPEDTAVDLTPQQISDIGTTYIGDFKDATATAITGNSVTFDLGAVPVSGAEVRLIDGGWGVDDGNRLLLTTSQTFSLARTALDQTYYIRQINGPKTSRYTSAIRVVYPLVPTIPGGTLDTRDWLKPVVQSTLTGDIRNICGLEVRSCMTSVSGGVSGQFAANYESPIECLDMGLIGTDPSVSSTVPIGNQNFTTSRKKFTRSEFLLDASAYPPSTQFYFEAVVTNAAYRDVAPREIYIEKQMRGRSNPNPVFVHTLSVPPGTHRQRIRFSAPFTGYQYDTLPPSVEGPSVTGATDYTDAYRVWMQAESPPVLAYPPATTIFPSSPFELHSLRLIGVSPAATRSAIEIPLTSTEGESSTDLQATAVSGSPTFSTASAVYVDVTPATIWVYNAAEWSTLLQYKFNATLSSPQSAASGQVVAGLYDITASQIIAEASFPINVYPAQAACVQTSVTVSGSASGLVDGHQYTVRLRVVAPATTGYIYKARIVMILNPLLKQNVYWRYAGGPGSQNIRETDLGSFALTPGSFSSRLLYNPSAYSQLTGLFTEVTGAGTFSPSNPITDDFNRADGLISAGQSDWAGMGFASLPSIVSNEVFTNDNSRGALRTSSDTSVSHQFVQILYVRNFLFNAFGSASMVLWLCTTGFPVGGAGFNAYALMYGRQFGSLNAGILLQRYTGGVSTTLATLDGIFNFSGTQGFTIKMAADITATETTINVYSNGVLQMTYVDSSGSRKTNGKAGFSTAQVDGAGFWNTTSDDFSCGQQTAAPISMVDAGIADGPFTQLPGWFAYTSGDHIPAQNYTVTPNMAGFVSALAAIVGPKVDDYALAHSGIIFSAWQFQLFAAVLNNAPALAGVTTVNALRDTIIAGYVTAIAALHTARQDWVTASFISLSSASKSYGRTNFTSSLQLTDGDRYFAAPNTGLQQALLVYQVTAIDSTELDIVPTLPVPQYPTALLQRRFFSPSDLNYIFDNNPYRLRSLCFRVLFFNLMWEYSGELEITANLIAPKVPKIEVISVLSIDIQVRLDVIGTEDTTSVTVEMAPTSLFIGSLVRVKGGPLQSVYSLHVPTGPNTPIAGQYIRARRTDYLGSSDWSGIVFISAASIRNSSFISSMGDGSISSNPLNNLFSYTSDGTTITWSWPAFTLTYSDGFVQYVNAGTFTTFTGLTASTTYKFYPYLDGVRQAISTVTILKSSVGGGTAEDSAAVGTTTSDGHTPLSRGYMIGGTTSGGFGSGSGGGVG